MTSVKKHPVRAFLLLLGPLAVATALVFVVAHPLVGGLVAVFAALFAAWLAVRSPEWLRRPGVIVLGVSMSAWLLVLGVSAVAGLFWHHLEVGSAWCGDTPLVIGECAGRDQSFLQGRRSYSETNGVPDKARCRGLIRRASGERVLDETEIPDDEALHPTQCPAWEGGPWTCFAKKRMSAGHDVYVTLYGFADDCERGRAWSLTNVRFDEMSELRSELSSRP